MQKSEQNVEVLVSIGSDATGMIEILSLANKKNDHIGIDWMKSIHHSLLTIHKHDSRNFY